MFKLDPQLAKDTIAVGQFELSLVLLNKDASYPWCILVPKRDQVKEIHHLLEVDQQRLIRESSHLAEVMTSIFAPTTMNIAALGNVVAQLHVHHIARLEGDLAWPGAVWGAHPRTEYEALALKERLSRLRASLVGEGFEIGTEVAQGDGQVGSFSP